MPPSTRKLVLLLASAGVLAGLFFAVFAPTPKPAPSDAARILSAAPAAPDSDTDIPLVPTAADHSAFAAKLADRLNRSHVRADEALLTFASREALTRFLARARAAGVEVIGRIDSINALRVRIRDYAAFTAELAAHHRDYAGIGANVVFTPPTPPPVEDRAARAATPVGADLLRLLGVDPADTSRGRGVTIAILDSGVAPGTAFGDRLSYLDVGYGTSGGDTSHGTAVAALAAGADPRAPGVAPAADLLAIKVTDRDGLADTFSVTAGLLAAIEDGAQIVNISLGAYADSPMLADAIERALSAGIAVVAAAGNDQAARLAWPAAYPGVVSVGAVDAAGVQAIFSNAGDTLQLTAPGYGITTTGADGALVSFSGTSGSAPVTAGAIAAVLSESPDVSPIAAADILATHANDGGPAGADPAYGNGSLNLGWALDREDPARIDPAIASLGHDSAANTLVTVVQNRGNRTLSGLMLNLGIDGTSIPVVLPTLAAGASTTLRTPLPNATSRADGLIIIRASLQLPAGLIDRDTTNNQRTAALPVR